MSPLFKRVGLLAAAAALLGACDFEPTLAPDVVAPGSSMTISNEDGQSCYNEKLIVDDAAVAAPAELPVDIFVVTDIVELSGGGEAPTPDATTFADTDGFFSTTLPAPSIPGEHLAVAVCGGVPDEPTLQAAADSDGIDEDGVLVDVLRVTQAPLTIALDDDTVEAGDTVTATFNRCQDENNFGIDEASLSAAAEPSIEDLATDYPDLAVFLDGVLVDTIEGTERYPTGTVDVPVTIATAGAHEIKGICTFQTVDLDEVLLAEIMATDADVEPVSAAAIDYPFEAEGLTWDEDTTTAAAPVTVAAVSGAGAAPVVAAPRYTG